MISVTVKRVSKYFSVPGGGLVKALNHISLDIAPSEFVILVGHNGSGKSTFLNLIAGRNSCDEGSIEAFEDGCNLYWNALSARRRSYYLARVYQDPRAGTINELTVAENIWLATFERIPSPVRRGAGPAEYRQIQELLSNSPIAPKHNVLAGDLSQGERQLLAIEMAMARKVKLLLLDEHTASLDRRNAEICMERLQTLWQRTRTTIVMVTHDIAQALTYGDRLIVFRDGTVASEFSGPAKRAVTLSEIVELFVSPTLR
jgi:putative tryptophan/tyrosine transport system ATP-binding protein